MIFVNFKTYPESTGENAVKLARVCKQVLDETTVPIIPIVQACDVWRVTQEVHIPVWVQHVDPYEPGTHTGFTIFESVVSSGATGTLLNHSEHQIPFDQCSDTITRIRKKDSQFKIMVCAPNIEIVKNMKLFAPDFLAYEPPELIGNDTASVATVHPEVIDESIQVADGIPLVVGAGIKTKVDVEICCNKNIKGVLISSGIVLSKNPVTILKEFAEACRTS